MVEILFLGIGLGLGIVIGVLILKKNKNIYNTEEYKALDEKSNRTTQEFYKKQELLQEEKWMLTTKLNTQTEQLHQANQEIAELHTSITLKNELYQEALINNEKQKHHILSQKQQTELLKTDYLDLKNQHTKIQQKNVTLIEEKITLNGKLINLEEKLQLQKTTLTNLQTTFEKEFKISSQQILEQNNERFIKNHQKSLDTVLKPLEKDLASFKSKVEELYITEAKERFNLSEELKKLNQLNQSLKEEAHNLTQALKTESKTQGGWGEMILESILEKSGLRKDEEYFMEHQLIDKDGKPLKSDVENKKMRPDAVVKYPGDRHVIIDSKVSLNSFLKYANSDTDIEQKTAINQHVKAIKNHVDNLSTKGYDDYNKALDFVMLFIPSEPAYIAAVQHDPNLWNYAYEKRILILNPTNLITSLKLIVDLWKREYQNKNVQAIVERGSKMYDKFAAFVNDLESVGDFINKAKNKHQEAYKKLISGNDNLVLQMDKLKGLGLKNKKELRQEMVDNSKYNPVK